MSRKQEQASGATLIVGRNPVREALERGEPEVEKVMLQKGAGGRPIHDIRQMASEAGVPVQYVPEARLSAIAPGLNHQGVAAVVSAVTYAEVDALLSAIAPDPDAVRRDKPLLVVLDQIQDPHNFGAILRSAVAAGAAGVFVPKHGMAPLNAAAVKASAGTATRIPVARAGNLGTLLYQLKERGYWIVGAAGEGAVSMWEMDWDRPLALVIGSEGSGLRERTARECDYLVSIPMRGPAESLNASVAAGILLFVATRDRAIPRP